MAVPLIPGRVLVGSYLLHLRLDLAWSQEPATRVMTTQLASLQAAAAQDGVQILVVPLMASGFLRQPMSELTLRQYAEPLYAEEGVAAVYAAGLDGQLRGQIMDTIQAAAWTAEQSADVLEEARARFAREAKFA